MAVTSQQVADAAGVSRGTVDRAINNRGRIKPEVAERVRRIAKEMGYQPNRAGRALVMSRKAIKIGVIIQPMTPFMEKVMEGVVEAKKEVEQMGAEVLIREIENMDVDQTVKTMQELKEAGCNGIAVVPVEDERVRRTIDEFAGEHIPVVTLNCDIQGSKRICFIGPDALQSGRVAAGLMAEILPEGSRVLMISGYPTNNTNKNRINGFSKELVSCREDIKLLDVQYAFEDDRMSEMITKGMLKEYEDIGGIYLSASGVQGVCRALEELGMTGCVKVISNDLTDQNKQFLREGRVQFLLGQEGHRQGYEPVQILFDKLFDGKEREAEFTYTEISIKTKYNLM